MNSTIVFFAYRSKMAHNFSTYNLAHR